MNTAVLICIFIGWCVVACATAPAVGRHLRDLTSEEQ